MMRQYELVERVAAYNPQVNEDLLNRAYVYAMQKHGSQKRASGDPYFSHPLEVAAILTDLKLDDASVAVGLLHDTIEDTSATRDEIGQLFGPKIAKLVDGLTKIERLDLMSREVQQAETLRKLLLAVSDDVRVLLVKLADRLHNMRTIQHVREDKRSRIAEETMDIYAPLAGRMGMQAMRDELEDCAFRVLHPDAYATISAKLAELSDKAGPLIETINSDLLARLEEKGIVAKIKGRQKRPYSIFSKMQRKSVGFEQLSDIIAYRILVDDLQDCYGALGVVHTTWRMVPGRFKDYISIPKQNDYRSLHTTIVGPQKQRIELQIRTEEMDRIAENGIAAHPLYKDGIAGDRDRLTAESRAYAWLRQTVENIAQGGSSAEFLEHTKLELFQDQVFCFTPKGRLITLPRGATPIDFAYAVHTDVGDSCVGAKVNGRLMPLIQPLQNGDEVEIIRSSAQRPAPAWEQMVITGKARAAIRRATRNHLRKQYSGLGRHTVSRRFAQASRTFSDEALKTILPRLGFTEVEDALAAVGRGDVTADTVLNTLYPEMAEESTPVTDRLDGEEGWVGSTQSQLRFRVPQETGDSEAVPLHGLHSEIPVHFAPNGGAVPGDRIVGILTPGEGITIYPIHSPSLGAFDDEPDRWLDVRWDISDRTAERYPARIKLLVRNEPGSLAAVAEAIAARAGNIENVRMFAPGGDFTEMEIDLGVWDLKHLNRIISDLRTRPVVNEAHRVNG
ncbi:guanosine-3',5'-bis(diphosphate) 3'-pyrophosphohydrolase [Faunimonas pinastri]|uniref:GTP pyrophosphokinase rsh n=1 Tax=Faunimonas pinastri TaxID=1855383 RepID=A0A1H9KUI5_9HYPH|nr:bifunctional (p)ppGpp synthetase/guanosine-3',5'-bis(diphosphate) 3'-pyrophosphohydrolase [Faunimonas pinastri]SER02852.1 guanosine-3',5'-bis(diphosphate) 3'-pyrophosphohydrolase [Faunimonas pinastri]